MGESEEGLRAENKRLDQKLAKSDAMHAEQHARIVQLEAIVASVKVRDRAQLPSMATCRLQAVACRLKVSDRRLDCTACKPAWTMCGHTAWAEVLLAVGPLPERHVLQV